MLIDIIFRDVISDVRSIFLLHSFFCDYDFGSVGLRPLLLFCLLLHIDIFLDFFPHFLIVDQIDMLFQLFIQVVVLFDLGNAHPIVPKSPLSPLPNVVNFLHCCNCFDVQVTVVDQWLVPLLLKVENGVVCELFSVCFSVCFGPGNPPWIMLGLEVAMTLRSAEPEHFTVVAHEGNAVSRVDWSRAEVALLYFHFNK